MWFLFGKPVVRSGSVMECTAKGIRFTARVDGERGNTAVDRPGVIGPLLLWEFCTVKGIT